MNNKWKFLGALWGLIFGAFAALILAQVLSVLYFFVGGMVLEKLGIVANIHLQLSLVPASAIGLVIVAFCVLIGARVAEKFGEKYERKQWSGYVQVSGTLLAVLILLMTVLDFLLTHHLLKTLLR